MGKKYKNIYDKICDIDNIRLAYKKAVRGGNRYTVSHLKFKENLEANLFLLQKSFIDQTYKQGDYFVFKIYEPKERVISALPFRDRVAQHAINNIIEPIFDAMFYKTSYACRKNKGTHRGVVAVQSTLRKMVKNGTVYYLKMDFSKYFYSIKGSILEAELSKKIKDKKVMNLLSLFYGETGIPIGNLLSQLFANIYGHIFDRFIKEKLRIKSYFRYMDDTLILHHNNEFLKRIKNILEKFSSIYMKLRFSKWHIQSLSKPINFLGYRMTDTYKLIRKDSVLRAKRKIKKLVAQNNRDALLQFFGSWGGHIKTADSFHLFKFINKEFSLCQMKLQLHR